MTSLIIINKNQSQMNIFFFFYLVFSMLFYSGASSCSATFNPIELLQSGKKKLVKQENIQQKQLSFQVSISFQVPPSDFEFATTLSSISNYNTENGISYLVSARKKGYKGLQIILNISPSLSWSIVEVGYLISARNDLLVHNDYSSSQYWIKKEPRNFYDAILNIQKDLPIANYKVAAFISGFSTAQKQPKIAINQKQFDQKQKKLTITVICNFGEESFILAISYIIYQDTDSFYEIPFGDFKEEDSRAFQLVGPNLFPLLNFIKYTQFRAENRSLLCIGSKCSSECITAKKCRQNAGNIDKYSCTFCQQVDIVFQSGNCKKRCLPNQIFIDNVCLCLNGYIRRGDNCVLQVPNSLPQRLCINKQIRIGNQCVTCPPSSLPSQGRTSCVCPVGQNYKLDTNTCVLECSGDQKYDISVNGCVKNIINQNPKN